VRLIFLLSRSSLTSPQYAGTRTGKTTTSSINPYFFMRCITTLRSPSTAHSYHRRTDLRLSLFRRSPYVPTPHAHAATSSISRGRGTLNPHLKFWCLLIFFGFQKTLFLIFVLSSFDSIPKMVVFTAGIVLLMNIWSGKRSYLSTDPNKEMADVHKCMGVMKTSEVRWYSAGRFGCAVPISTLTSDLSNLSPTRDALRQLASIEELPLTQASPTSRKRKHESDTSLSTSPSESPLNPMLQNEIPRATAGSRRVRTDASFIGQTQQPQSPQQCQQPQISPQPPEMHTYNLNIPPPQQAPSRRRSNSQIRQNPESKRSTSTIPPFINVDLPVFALPVYSNELGRFPLHEQVTFSAQAHHPQPQTHSPQPGPQINHWYTMPVSASAQGGERSEPTPHGGPSGASSSHWLRLPPAPAPQQQHYNHPPHPNHTSRTNGFSFSSISEISSTTQGLYGLDAAQMATNMVRDPTHFFGPTDLSSQGVESSSAVYPFPHSSSGSSIEDGYGDMGMDLSGGDLFHHLQQHLGVPQQQEQQPLTHPFVVDSHAIDLQSNDPAGFECVYSAMFFLCVILVPHFPFFFFSIAGWMIGVPTLRASVS